PARLATSSSEASYPCSRNTSRATSINRSRLRCASARMFHLTCQTETLSVLCSPSGELLRYRVPRPGASGQNRIHLVSSSENTTLTHDLPTELPAHAGRAATGIAIVLVAQLMLVLDATVVNVALPRIDTDPVFGPASLSWVLNAYTLAFGGLLLLGGRLGDVRGRL